MKEVDIVALTKEAEAGNGCAIKDGLQGLGFDDTVVALRQIAQQNQLNRDDNKNLPQIQLFSAMGTDNGTISVASVGLTHPGKHWYSTPDRLFESGIALRNGPHQIAGERHVRCQKLK